MNLRSAVLLFIMPVLLSGFIPETKAQSIQHSVDLIGVASNHHTTPFWIQSNRHGLFSNGGNMLLGRIKIRGNNDLKFFDKDLSIHYGTDFIARSGFESRTHSFNQAYVKVNAYGVELAGGRFHTVSPAYNDRLGMGSLGVSGNAVPVPQIRLGLQEWTPLPFTGDFIEVRGHAAHGWFGGNRFTENVLYHEKIGYVRFGGDFLLNLYGGIAHYAKWGGKNNPRYGDLPSKFNDFWRVFFALNGGDDAPATEADYMLGDHLGAWDFGFFLELNSNSLVFYRQHPLETKDNLKLKSLQDALTGVSVEFGEGFDIPVRGFVYEFLYTKWQDGPRVENTLDDGTPCGKSPLSCRDHQRGNENYYNHGIYRTGWATHGRTLGNPLFRIAATPMNRLGEGIDNNRIVAHHIGFDFDYGDTAIIGKLTKSRSFGTRNNPFPEPKDQVSFGFQSETPVQFLNQPFLLLADVAWDIGDLFGNQIGVLLGIRVGR